MIDLKFCTHNSNRLLYKSMPTIFLVMSYSVFVVILWKILKSHFEPKQSKTDCPKNILKEEKCVHVFLGSLLYTFKWEKNIENHKCFGAGACKVENLIRFLSNFGPYFLNVLRARKRCKTYIESIGIYCKNIESMESMEEQTLESNALPFHFCIFNSVQVYDIVERKMHLILMSRGRNGKTTKVTESNLVLCAEFLLTTFSFDLALTAHVFCVALHQSFEIRLFHLEIHSLYVCEHLIK